MERLERIACCFRWAWGQQRKVPHAEDLRHKENSKRLCGILESILLWDNSVNSISVVVVFNILFWGIVVLEIRGFAAASSAALVVILCYSTLEAQVDKEKGTSDSTVVHPKTEKIDKIIDKVKSTYDGLKTLRENQPGVFCAGVCTASVVFWLIGRAVSGVLLTYTICMSILLGPVLLLRIPSKIFPTKEWDNEIEEFLPAVTEDNLEVLKRAGEDGDHSPTPPSGSNPPNDPFNDDELIGLKMPSHEDGSTDGLELSELELSTDDHDVVDIKTRHFEGTSSSEDDGELELRNQEISSQSEDSESEFEIIDSHEINDFDHKV